MLQFSDISGRFKEKYKSAVSFGRHYFDAIKWCLAVLVLLFLPIICASLFDGFLDVSIKEQEYFRGLFYNHLVGYIKNGSFILVIIGLSGAAYIDYFFEFKFNRWETGVHFWFWSIIAVSLIIYTVIYLFELGDQIEIDGVMYHLDEEYVNFWSWILFASAFVYSLFVKSTLLEYRSRIRSEQHTK